MGKISRYIGRQVMAAILLVLLLVVGLDVIAAVIDQLGDLGGGYTFSSALIYVMLTVPGRLHEYLPLASLVGGLVAMGSLSSSSELIVLRACGISVWRLVWQAARPVLLLIFLSLAISEYLSPYSDQWAQSYKDYSRWGSERSLTSTGGLWHREGDTFMHLAVVQPGGVLYGVTHFVFDANNHLLRATFAERATYQSDSWLMEGVRETQFGAAQLRSGTSITQRWETQLSPELLRYLALSPEDMSLSGLQNYSQYLDRQGLDSGEYRLAFWQKALHPLAVLGLVVVAMSFVFGPLRESTAGYRVFVGVVVGITFQFAQNLLGPSSLIYGHPPLYSVLLPIVFCFALGFFLLGRAR